MQLGAFSVSLAVKDSQASRAFYEKFGFTAFTAEADEQSTGPASFMATDPDGNTLLFDQHR